MPSVVEMNRRARRAVTTIVALILACDAFASAPSTPPNPADVELFEKKIRPVFVEHCLECHGPKKQEMGLRLDVESGWRKGSDSGPIVDPSHPEKSLLLSVLGHAGDTKMPPKGKLPDATIASIRSWIERGAAWPAEGPVANSVPNDHWAFRPIARHQAPKVKRTDWVRSPIDSFILARLEERGLTPSPPADRRTLLRRVTFDLTGLFPTPQETKAFLEDTSSEAFAKVVDRLLASPHYGERWGRHWLDVARYGDAKAYVFTEDRRYRHAYVYRDYVIESLNSDLPVNRFLMEQIAADLMSERDDRRHLAALGFLTLGRRYLNDFHEIIDDRIDVVSRGMMGLTVTCARCHDHKFDPIPAEDYYSLYGVFASSVEPDPVVLPRKGSSPHHQEFDRLQAEKQKEISTFLESKRDSTLSELRPALWRHLLAGLELDGNPDHGKLGEIAKKHSLRPELLRWVMRRWNALVADAAKPTAPSLIGFYRDVAVLPEAQIQTQAVELALKRAVPPAFLESLKKTPIKSRQELLARCDLLWSQATKPAPSIDPKQSKTADKGSAAAGATALDPAIAPWFEAALAAFELNSAAVEQCLGKSDADHLGRLRGALKNLQLDHPGAPPRAMVLADAPEPTNPYVFVRGNPGRRGKTVPRQFLGVLGKDRKPFAKGSGRLELAEAIVAPSNPLTPRVFVNRVWMLHFSQGLVKTVGDFGTRGDAPSHPELLDELAGRFIESGWSLKALHRLILLSNTYQQQSHDRSECAAIDPENRLLWKYPRRRLDFEGTRDNLLAAAGRLDLAVGGRSVSLIEQPFTTRRTLYGYIDRQNLDPVFRTFDFPNPNVSAPQRYQTTTPQQALFLMNSPFALEQVGQLARHRRAATGESIEDRVQSLYERLYNRPATSDEVAQANDFLRQADRDGVALDASPWRYGYGEYDAPRKKLAVFHQLTNWTGKAWRLPGPFPHPTQGALEISVSGGHPGTGSAHAAVRRWTAPRSMTVRLIGALERPARLGDGVRAIVAMEKGLELGQWKIQRGKVATNVDRVEIKGGEAIDFIVEPVGSADHDSFRWPIEIEELSATAERGARDRWSSVDDFSGPPESVLDAWEQYVQALLLSNEFHFVD